MKNVFYMHKLNSIGGVESFLYYLSKLYDIEVYYTEADIEQVKRLAKNIPVHKYTGKPIECDRLFSNYRFSATTTAKDKYHIIHYDPLNVKFGTTYEKGWNYIGVSKVACNGFKETTGHDAELIYNPVPIERIDRQKRAGLRLISATRLTSEKGEKRINKLAKLLDKTGVSYSWDIYTNKKKVFDSPHIKVLPPKLNLTKEIAESSYLVQLSDCESFGLSVCESLILGTPVIITDLEAFKEIGCINRVNAYICDFDMGKVDLSGIIKNNLKFDYIPPKSEWDKYLSREKNYDPEEIVKVRTLKRIHLVEKDIHTLRNQIIEVSRSKASELECLGYAELIGESYEKNCCKS